MAMCKLSQDIYLLEWQPTPTFLVKYFKQNTDVTYRFTATENFATKLQYYLINKGPFLKID